MQAIAEEGVSSANDTCRKLLVAVDDNRACEGALDWALKEFYR